MDKTGGRPSPAVKADELIQANAGRPGKRSPDGAERKPGLPRGVDAAPDFAALHTGYELSALLEPHAGLIAVGELDAGFFQRVPDDVDGAGLQRFAGFETYDGAGRDLRHFRKLAHAQFQSGSRHAALGGMHRYNVSSLT
jgi:hypothetical protein